MGIVEAQCFKFLPGLVGEPIPQHQDKAHRPIKSSSEVVHPGKEVSPRLFSGSLRRRIDIHRNLQPVPRRGRKISRSAMSPDSPGALSAIHFITQNRPPCGGRWLYVFRSGARVSVAPAPGRCTASRRRADLAVRICLRAYFLLRATSPSAPSASRPPTCLT